MIVIVVDTLNRSGGMPGMGGDNFILFHRGAFGLGWLKARASCLYYEIP